MTNVFVVDSVGGISGSLTQLSDGRSYMVAGEGIAIVSQSSGQVLVSSLGSSVPNINVSGSNLGFYSASPVVQAPAIGHLEPMYEMYNVYSAWSGGGASALASYSDFNFGFISEKITQIVAKINAIDTCLSQVSGGIGITE